MGIVEKISFGKKKKFSQEEMEILLRDKNLIRMRYK
jgi:hypothetical protein